MRLRNEKASAVCMEFMVRLRFEINLFSVMAVHVEWVTKVSRDGAADG